MIGEIERGRAHLEFGIRDPGRFQLEQLIEVAIEPLPYPVDLLARLEDDGKHQRAPQPRSGSGPQRRVSVHEAPRLLDVRVFAHHGETEESVAVSGVDVEDFPVPLLRLALPVAILERGGQAQHRARARRIGRRKVLERAGVMHGCALVPAQLLEDFRQLGVESRVRIAFRDCRLQMPSRGFVSFLRERDRGAQIVQLGEVGR